MIVNQLLLRAAQRCAWLARSERLMGYPESGDVYSEMSAEFSMLVPWVLHAMATAHTGELEDQGQFLHAC